MTIDDLMTSTQAVDYLAGRGIHRKLSTLQWWGSHGYGPSFVRVGRGRFYTKATLDRFITSVIAKQQGATAA
jgi:hypothetical protein